MTSFNIAWYENFIPMHTHTCIFDAMLSYMIKTYYLHNQLHFFYENDVIL